jgi:hypothetical protein
MLTVLRAMKYRLHILNFTLLRRLPFGFLIVKCLVPVAGYSQLAWSR